MTPRKQPQNRGCFSCIFGFFFLNFSFSPCFSFFIAVSSHLGTPKQPIKSLRLLNALNSEDRGLKVRFSLAMIAFDRESAQMLSSQGKNAPSNPYPHYLLRLAASRMRLQAQIYTEIPCSSTQREGTKLSKIRIFSSSCRTGSPTTESTGCRSRRTTIGARQKGDSKWEKPVSAIICGFLRFPAKICGFLRESATPKSLDLQSELKISENLQKSAKMCVPGPVSPFCCLPFGAP